jgi:hypothetical protein
MESCKYIAAAQETEMATKTAAVKGLADMNNSQKAMIHNIEAITERLCEKIGGELTPAQREEIASSVVSKYLTSTQSMFAQHLCFPPAKHSRMVSTIVTTVAKQFSVKVTA